MIELNTEVVRLAYGILWSVTTDIKGVHEARRLLSSVLSSENKMSGIQEARNAGYNGMTETEVMKLDVQLLPKNDVIPLR